MKGIKEKWNSSRGASLLIAMVYVLLALMVGIVVLTAASSNAGRVAHNRQEQREYFAVKSAVSLVQKNFDGASLEWKVTTNSEGERTTSLSITDGGLLEKKKSELSSLLEGKSSRIETNLSFEAKDSGGTDVKAIPQVEGTLTIERTDGEYPVTVYLYCVGDDGGKSNPVTMQFTSSVTTKDEEGAATETVETTKITWETPTVEKGVLS